MRERLTITLKQDLLEALDANIDGDKLRNRSHAIEYYLSKSLGQKALKVLILAGGKPVDFGKAHGGKLPKAMVKIAGKPLLEQTLLKLKSAKFKDIIISLGEGGKTIRDYFKTGEALGLHIQYIEQDKSVTGPASALLQAKKWVDNSNFLLIYGDVLSDIDFSDLIQFHSLNKPSICTMTLTSTESIGLWGLAKLQGSRVVEFEEKPQNPKTFSRLINAGVYLMEPAIFKYINPHPNPLPEGEGKKAVVAKLESGILPRLAEEGKLYGYVYEGLWLDISNSAVYRQAIKQINN
jgi:NDP-sugar pyrophosphorylase family protein